MKDLRRTANAHHAIARALAVLIAMVLLPFATVVLTSSAANAATTAKVAVKTQKMTGPHLTSYTQKGWYEPGITITLKCYVRGQTVSGWGGSSDLWYQISDGYYAADVDLNTGSNDPITAKCPSSLSTKVDAFKTKWLGKAADYDGAYGAQCVDLFNFYNRDVIGATRAAVSYAYQLYDVYDSSKYTRVSASSAPKKGDVAVYASTTPGSGGAGHVALVLGTSGSSLVVLQQNANGRMYVTQDNASKSNLRGYLRPKV